MHAIVTTTEPTIRHHDLLVELGSLEMAMEKLAGRAEAERGSLEPRIRQRMARVREALAGLAA